MKKKLSTRIVSVFLSLLMVVSILPAGAITASAASLADLYWPVWKNDTPQKTITYHFNQWIGTAYTSDGYHHGIDIKADTSCSWYSACDGKIFAVYNCGCKTRCGHNYGVGNGFIIVKKINNINYYFQYCHMSSINKNLKKGQNIKKGTYLGTVGASGNTTGVHAHFEVNSYQEWANKAYDSRAAHINNDPTKTGCKFSYSYTYINNTTKPSSPKITSNVSGDVALGTNVTVSWSAVSGATGYIVKVNGKQVQKNTAKKYAFTASTAQKYEITVSAYNSAGESSASNKITVTAKNPSTVIFKDYDGTELNRQTVAYGKSAVAPTVSREGYTFNGWDGAYNNVTQNLTITATYKINTYTVKFTDKDGNVLSTQKIDYLNDAVPPDNTNTPTGYEFLGWSSDDYLSVHNDVTVQGIYAWGNTDLPIVVTNMTAQRQDDGYYVYFDLTNYPDAVTRGRAVVSLKTAEGKLVDTTESAAFSIPKNGTKTGMEVFIPCEKAATKAEVIIVNSYSSGVPISEIADSVIDQGKMWSEWSTEKPDENTYEVESRTEYRYRDKETSTANTKTKDGWTWDGTSTSVTGNWSAWQDTAISEYTTESTVRQVGKQTVNTYSSKRYHYFRYTQTDSAHAYRGNYYKSSTYKYKQTTYSTSQLTKAGTDSDTSQGTWNYYKKSCACSNAQSTLKSSPCHYWYLEGNSTTKAYYADVTGTKTQYRYRDTTYTYNFYRWKDWSDWSENSVTANSDKEVETRTVYRYKSNDVGIEDTSGETRTASGKLDSSFAGKQATLFIYKVDEASDYSNEYVAQTIIADDGSYSFTYKLREEPTVKTGDFTIALGVEGTTNTFVIGTIEAPKPEYTVNFYDYKGNIINTQTVTEGGSAEIPTIEDREGYTFIGWDSNTTNIKDNLDVHPNYYQNEYTVVFVNWETDTIDIKSFLYGEPITPPDVEVKEGYNLTGWEGLSDSKAVVTENMVVTATYERDVFEVNFYDFDGNIISTQNVEYGDAAEEPEDLEADNIIFLGWEAPENADYTEVTENMDLYPQYVFEETTDTPSADIKTGVYDDKQTVTLSCPTENSVIYYTLDGSDPADNGVLYTEPITISQTCNLRFTASTFSMNDSEEVSEYYCINNPDIPSDWFAYDELPQTVIDNFDSYTMEMDTGYKYKDIKQVSDIDSANQLRAEGWLYNESKYTDYTEWQDEIIEYDETKPGFEVDTRETEDTTVTRYQYSHYKYTDENGDIQYSKGTIDGYECTYEQIVLDNNLSIAGFETIDDVRTAYYSYDSQKWYSQTRVSGVKTQYRSRYQVDEYIKWTNWTTDAPSSSETREYITDDVYRYFNKNHYIVNIVNVGLTGDTILIQENNTIDISEYDNVYGFDLEGLYTDSEFNNQFDLSTPITESVTLYAKYIPKQYQVIFQMEDGTELDTQTVEYLQSATAPATDVVPGYIFGGWDKEFDCITEDIVITGRYFDESEYTRVSFDKTSATAVTGTSFTLTAIITPSDLADEEVEWSSSDTNIAEVDENGNVTAISAGTATIICVAVKTKEFASCTVKVLADDSNYILLKTDSSLNYDSLGYLRRIGLKTPVETASKEFTNDVLKFYDINGAELESADYVGTGTQIKLFNGSNAVDTKTVVVTGDMTGDGIINNRDVAMMNKKLVDKADALECQMLAIDVNGDGSVDNKDAAMVARYLVGKDAF